MYCTTTVFEEKYIFVDYSQVYKSRPLKKKVDHSLVDICYFVPFTVISSKLNITSRVFLVPGGQLVLFFSLSLLVVTVCPEDIVTTML